MDRFKNKYRTTTARAQWWDYGWNGAYFITICTRNREHYFGEILDGKMNLSGIGHFAETCWYEIPNHFPLVKMGEFVVMPNHVHGIVIINKTDDDQNRDQKVGTQNFAPLQSTPEQTLQPSPDGPKNRFGPQSKNLASIVRGFKIGVTKNARMIDPGFGWQSRFHDHIIRNEGEYHRISDYIVNNPANWRDDKLCTR